MPTERQLQEALRERSFRELFPWKNLRKALFLLMVIVGVVILKRQIDPLLKLAGTSLSPPASQSVSPPMRPHPPSSGQ